MDASSEMARDQMSESDPSESYGFAPGYAIVARPTRSIRIRTRDSAPDMLHGILLLAAECAGSKRSPKQVGVEWQTRDHCVIENRVLSQTDTVKEKSFHPIDRALTVALLVLKDLNG